MPSPSTLLFQVSSGTRIGEEREGILREEKDRAARSWAGEGGTRETGRREETRAEKIKGGLKSGD